MCILIFNRRIEQKKRRLCFQFEKGVRLKYQVEVGTVASGDPAFLKYAERSTSESPNMLTKGCPCISH